MQVTVLMPAYNAERFIGEAIESVLAQTHKDFEFLILDDGSTDGTFRIAEQYATTDDRIGVVARPRSGLCNNLNYGLSIARNELIVSMHADDVMLPNRIERQLSFLGRYPEVAVASSFVYYINSLGKITGKFQSPLTETEKVREKLRQGKLIGFHHPGTIFRRSVIEEVGGYRQEFWPCEDIDLWHRVAEAGYSILIQPEYLLRYRIHGGAASVARAKLLRKKHDWIEDCISRRRNEGRELSWEEFLRNYREQPWWLRLDRERRDLAKIFYKNSGLHYAEGNYGTFAPNLLAALCLQPTFVIRQVTSKYMRGAKA